MRRTLEGRAACRPLPLLALCCAGGCSAVVSLDPYGAGGPLDLATGLLAHWRLDDGFGAAARDASGHEHHGALRHFTTPRWTEGRNAGALRFEGASKEHLAVASAPRLNPTTQVTVAAWANAGAWCDSTPANVSKRVLQKGDEPTQYRLLCESGQLHFAVGDRLVTAPLPSTDAWHHLAGSYDGKAVRLYVDGRPVAQQPSSGPVPVTAQELYIAAKNPWGSYFQGLLDDVAVWGRALAEAEVAALASGIAPGTVY